MEFLVSFTVEVAPRSKKMLAKESVDRLGTKSRVTRGKPRGFCIPNASISTTPSSSCLKHLLPVFPAPKVNRIDSSLNYTQEKQ